MSQRTSQVVSLLCYGGAVLLAVLGIFAFMGTVSGWGFLVGSAILVHAGTRSVAAMSGWQSEAKTALEQAVQAKSQLARQRTAVDALADGLEIAIFICDSHAGVLYANRRATEFFRFEDPIGRSILAITLSYDLEQLVLEAFRQKAPHQAEMSFSYPAERVGLVKAWLGEDDPERVFLSIYEITDLRRLERIRQDFVSNVSHELRTPLTIIRSMTETLLDDPVPNPELSAKYLPKIISEVDRLSMISNDLLILSVAESNPVRTQRCDIAELFRTTLEQMAPAAREKDIQTRYEGPKHLEVDANPAQMTQVAMNLIDNAISYTNQGEIVVSVAEADGEAVVKVTDTGLGIPSEHQPRIFERFYRVDKARSRVSGGTGLGLSIVKHIVESHGGRVEVDSALNQGSTFTLRLPSDSASAE